jgi:diguanylate cyclase
MPAKNISFAKRIYLPRALGSAVGFCAVAAVLCTVSTPAWVWALLIFHAFAWPHVAFLLARRVAVPYVVERRNMVIESAFGGLWVAAMHFNMLPTTMMVSMLSMNCIAVGGPRLLGWCMGALTIALVAFTVILHPGFVPATTPLQVYACLPMLAIYPLTVGGSAYRLASKLAEHKRAFRDYSRTDSLTGLLNQGAWRVALEEEYALGKREAGSATIALIDIDHFKAVNDGHGHLTGDEVLKMFAAVLGEVKRSTDIAGRLGGDEFGLILRGSDEAQAGNLLARLQQQLGDTFTTQPELPAVSLSIGVATFSLEHDNVEAWLRSCDRALYEAKRQGRNQIVLSANDLGSHSQNAVAAIE